MDGRQVTARIAAAELAFVTVGLRLQEEAPGRAIAVATDNGHLLLDYYFLQGGRAILLQFDGVDRRARISGTLWKPQGRLWLLDLDQVASLPPSRPRQMRKLRWPPPRAAEPTIVRG
jgi:hypothetical protein